MRENLCLHFKNANAQLRPAGHTPSGRQGGPPHLLVAVLVTLHVRLKLLALLRLGRRLRRLGSRLLGALGGPLVSGHAHGALALRL